MRVLTPFAAAATLLLAACASAPPVQPPSLAESLGETPPSAWTAAAADSAAWPADRWWEDFGDSTLTALVDEALAANHSLGAAAARVEQALAAARIQGAEGRPQVSAGLTGQRRKQLFLGFPIPGEGGKPASSLFSTWSLSADVSWELDLWGRLRQAESAARADAQAAGAEWAGARLSLAGQTARAWFAAVEAQRLLALSEETVASYERTVQATRYRYQRGLRPALDLRLSLSELATARAGREQAAQNLDLARRRLEVLLGRYPAAAVEAAVSLPSPGPAVPAGLPAELLARRPDLAAAERRLAAAGARLSSARRSLLPRLSLTGSAGTNSQDLGDLLDGDFGVWSLLGNLVQPLFQGGRLRAQVAQGRAAQREQLELYADTALHAFAEVENALVAEQRLLAREVHLREAKEQARQAYELADDRYRSGLSDLITLLSAQRRAVSSEIEWIGVRRAQLDARVNLILALGGGFHLPTVEAAEALAGSSASAQPPEASR